MLDDLGREAVAAVAERSHLDILPDTPASGPRFRDNAGPTDASVIRLIDNALRGAERGSSLTHRMLVFARRQELNFQPVDIMALVHGMAELLERSLGPSMRVETRFPLGLPWVNTDSNQLEMALLNLAVNARDAMPQGGPIVIAARPETVALAHGRLQPGEYVCLSLTDTGEGMDARAGDRSIFHHQGDGQGTGLGLPMVHGLAEHSGGQLILRSQKGRGTTAELWLPVAKKTEEATEPRRLLECQQKSTAD